MTLMRIRGGLGNQLFQYACGRSVSISLNEPLYLSISFPEGYKYKYLLNRYNIIENIGTRATVQTYKSIREVDDRIYSDIFETPNSYLNGYWQSEKYFKQIEDILKKEFTLKDIPIETIEERMIKEENSVAIHIRGCELFVDKNVQVCGKDYYDMALEKINTLIDKPKYFIFTDDVSYAKSVLPNYPIISSDDPCNDLRLMSMCKNFITANSTFSWWGAWLSDNKEKKIITPKKWLPDKTNNFLIPNRWITI